MLDKTVPCTRVLTGVDGVVGQCAVLLAALDKGNELGSVKVVLQAAVVARLATSTLKLTVNYKCLLQFQADPFILLLVMMVHVAILIGLDGLIAVSTVANRGD